MKREVENVLAFLHANATAIDPGDAKLIRMLQDKTGIRNCTIRPEQPAPIKKIDIFVVYRDSEDNSSNQITDIIIQETDNDNKKILKRVPTQYLMSFDYLLQDAGIVLEAAFLRPRVPALSESEWDELNLYEKEVKKNYEQIRQAIANEAVENSLNRGKFNLVLMDIGTGLGDTLDVTYQEYKKLFIDVIAVGIDTNLKNIENAKWRYKDKPYEFIQSDLKQLEKIIADKVKDPSYLVVLTSSGSMTRLVLNNTLEALIALQQAFRVADVFALGGETELLFTERITKKVGWSYKIGKSSDDKTTVVLTHDAPKIAKIKKGTLDLSLHADPLNMLQRFDADKLATITDLDLALAYIKPDEIKQILQLLPNVENILISGKEPWAAQLEAEIKDKKIHLQVEPNLFLDTEASDKRQWELKKHSKNFYLRFSEEWKTAQTKSSKKEEKFTPLERKKV